MNFISGALEILTNIFIKPRKGFIELVKKPSWVLVFVSIAFSTIGIAWIVLPFSIQLDSRFQMLEYDVYHTDALQKRIEIAIFHFIGVILSPVPSLIKCLIFAILLYLGASLLGSMNQFKFKLMYAVVLHAELILVLSNLINSALLLSFKKIDDIQNFTDLQVLPGLHLLLGSQAESTPYFTFLTFRFLSQFHLFSMWYLWVLSLGVSVVAKLNMRKSVLLTVTLWLAIISFPLLRSLLPSLM